MILIDSVKEEDFIQITIFVDSELKKTVIKELIDEIENKCPCYNPCCTCSSVSDCDCTYCLIEVACGTDSDVPYPNVSSPDVTSSDTTSD